MDSAIIVNIIIGLKLLIPAAVILWLTQMMMDAKQKFIAVLYLVYCVVNNYAVAAALLDDNKSSVNMESFALGLIGAITVCAWLQKIDQSPKTYGSLSLSMLLAGFGSHAAIRFILSTTWVKECACLDYDTLYYITPLLIGVIVPTLVPIALNYVMTTWGKGTNNA